MLFFFAYSTCHKFSPNAHVHETENRHLTDTGVDVEDKQVWTSDGFKNGHPTEMGVNHTMGL